MTHCEGIQCLFNLFYDLISFIELFSNPRRRQQLRLYYLKQGSIGTKFHATEAEMNS